MITYTTQAAFIRANRQLTRGNASKVYPGVDVGTDQDCTMEMALKDKKCTALVGDVEYQPGIRENKEVWSRISKVYGTILVNQINEDNLGYLKNISVEGWAARVVKIVNNRKLKHIDGLLHMKVSGPRPWFWLENNARFCHTTDIRKKLEARLHRKLQWEENCLRKCNGGAVDEKYLEQFDKFCNQIDGELVIERQEKLPVGIEKLAQIERINGRLVIKSNTAINDLAFFMHLKVINNTDNTQPSLEINDNRNFTLKGLDSIRAIHGDVLVVTENVANVPQDVNKKITKVTDGKASFMTFEQFETSKMPSLSNGPNGSDSTNASIEGGLLSTQEPLLNRQSDSRAETEEGKKGSSFLIIALIVFLLVVILVVVVTAVLVTMLVSKRKRENAEKKNNLTENSKVTDPKSAAKDENIKETDKTKSPKLSKKGPFKRFGAFKSSGTPTQKSGTPTQKSSTPTQKGEQPS